MKTKFYKVFVYIFLLIFLIITIVSYYFIINSSKIKFDSSLTMHKFVNNKSAEIIFENNEKVNFDVIHFNFCEVLKNNDYTYYIIIGKKERPFNGFSLFTLGRKFSKVKYYIPNNKKYYDINFDELTINNLNLKVGDSIFGKLKVNINPLYIGAKKKYNGIIFFKTVVKKYE